MLDIEGEIERGFARSCRSGGEVARLLESLIENKVSAAIARAQCDPEQLVDTDDAAKRLAMSVGAVRKAVERGKLPVRRIGRRVRFRLGDLLELARAR
jgi:excisionase family DNA binding protein